VSYHNRIKVRDFQWLTRHALQIAISRHCYAASHAWDGVWTRTCTSHWPSHESRQYRIHVLEIISISEQPLVNFRVALWNKHSDCSSQYAPTLWATLWGQMERWATNVLAMITFITLVAAKPIRTREQCQILASWWSSRRSNKAFSISGWLGHDSPLHEEQQEVPARAGAMAIYFLPTCLGRPICIPLNFRSFANTQTQSSQLAVMVRTQAWITREFR